MKFFYSVHISQIYYVIKVNYMLTIRLFQVIVVNQPLIVLKKTCLIKKIIFCQFQEIYRRKMRIGLMETIPQSSGGTERPLTRTN